MAHYTIQMRHLLEQIAGYHNSPADYQAVNDVLNATWDKVFGQYPIFNEEYREGLNKKILLHFYQEEIGFETEGQFLLKLNQKMCEIMPYYNKLYQSELLELDPWETTKYRETLQGSDSYNKEFKHGHIVDTATKQDTDGRTVSSGNDSTKQDTTTAYGKTMHETASGGEDVSTDTSGQTTSTLTATGKNNTTYGKVTSNKHDDVTNATDSGTVTGDNTSLNKFLDTPQASLDNFKAGKYLTDARQIDEDTKTVTKNDADTTVTGTWSNTDSGKDVVDTNNSESGGATYSGTDTTDKNYHSDTTSKAGGRDTVAATESATHAKTDETTQNTQGTAKQTNSGSDFDSRVANNAYVKEITGRSNVDVLDILQKLRDSFLNIDMMVIRELDILFMQIW